MYVNAKMIPIETIPGIGRVVEGVNSSIIYLIYCKNLCKCHNVPLPSTTIKEKILKNKANKQKLCLISVILLCKTTTPYFFCFVDLLQT
jgi:hypothetical protein